METKNSFEIYDMVKNSEEYNNKVLLTEKWVKQKDVQDMQFEVQKFCVKYFDMDTKEIIKLNKILKIKYVRDKNE